jgi:lysozyme
MTDTLLTKRVLLEVVCHEGIVKEAYKDTKNIWTWGIGVTNASGHTVERYIDNPQSINRVIEIYKWLLETKYLPDVLKAFEGKKLSESELAAALSFHYNTGAINKASWVKSYMKGLKGIAKQEFMNYRKPVEIIERRTKERDLFFNGKWSNDGTATVFEEVNKPSYTPKWGSAKRIDISKDL